VRKDKHYGRLVKKDLLEQHENVALPGDGIQ